MTTLDKEKLFLGEEIQDKTQNLTQEEIDIFKCNFSFIFHLLLLFPVYFPQL